MSEWRVCLTGEGLHVPLAEETEETTLGAGADGRHGDGVIGVVVTESVGVSADVEGL